MAKRRGEWLASESLLTLASPLQEGPGWKLGPEVLWTEGSGLGPDWGRLDSRKMNPANQGYWSLHAFLAWDETIMKICFADAERA